jgi:exopolysaccharide biosynthesis polyprenyl glycosylphosphotransferase
MHVVSFFDAVLLLVVAAAVGLPLTAWWTWVAVATGVGTFAATGHYRPRITLSVAIEAGSLAACGAAPFLVLALAKVPGPSTAALTVGAAFAMVAVVASRCGEYWLGRVMRRRGWFAQRTLFIGAGDVSANMAATLDEHPEYGLHPVGFLDEVDSAGLLLPLFGGVDVLRMVLSEERIDRVVVGFGVTREAEMVHVFRACEDASVEIHVLPRLFELATSINGPNVDDVWGYPLFHLPRSLVRSRARFAKRAFDASVAATALLVISPLYLAIALVVKLTSPGPVHFCQQRVGQRGVIVDVRKFRSMRVNSLSDEEWNPTNDAVTKIGHILRVTGFDELPQLWNILKGDMSFVGPRPERPFFVEQFKVDVPRYDDRHRVPVGLTGLAQVHGLRGDTSIDERARLDNQYIENWSLWRDVVILFQTFTAVIRNTFESRRRGKAVHDANAPVDAALGLPRLGGAAPRLTGLLDPGRSRNSKSESVRGGRLTTAGVVGRNAGDMSLMERTLPPAGLRPPAHRHPNSSEAYFVLQGLVSIVVDDEEMTVGPEGFVYVPRGTPHTFCNAGEDEARLLVIHAPAMDATLAELHQPEDREEALSPAEKQALGV